MIGAVTVTPSSPETGVERVADPGKQQGTQEAPSFQDALSAATRDDKVTQQEPKQDKEAKEMPKDAGHEDDKAQDKADGKAEVPAEAAVAAAAQVVVSAPSLPDFRVETQPALVEVAQATQTATPAGSASTTVAQPVQAAAQTVDVPVASPAAGAQQATGADPAARAEVTVGPDTGFALTGEAAVTPKTAKAQPGVVGTVVPSQSVSQDGVTGSEEAASSEGAVPGLSAGGARSEVSDSADAASDQSATGQARGAHDAGKHASRVAVNTTPVEWQFNGSTRGLQFATGPQSSTEAVAAVAGSTSESAANDDAPSNGSSAGGTSTGSTAGMPFPAAVQEAATRLTEPVRANSADLPARVMDQVVKEVKLLRFPDHKDLVVRLTPPELGTLRVQISQDSTGLTSQISASSEQVRGLLQAHLPALMDAFSDAGIRVDSVSVATDSSFNSMAQNASQQNAQNSAGDTRQRSAFGQRSIGAQPVVAAAAVPAFAGASQTAYSWLA